MEAAVLSLRGAGPAGVAVFIAVYWIASMLMIPVTFLSLAGGIVYGFAGGMAVVFIASLASAAASFLAARYLMREWIEKKLQSNPKVRALDEAVSKQGWKIVAMSRLTLLLPFALLNYFYGTTGIAFGHYFAATLIAMPPGLCLFVSLGSLAGSFAGNENIHPGQLFATAIAGVLSIVFVIYLSLIYKKALSSK